MLWKSVFLLFLGVSQLYTLIFPQIVHCCFGWMHVYICIIFYHISMHIYIQYRNVKGYILHGDVLICRKSYLCVYIYILYKYGTHSKLQKLQRTCPYLKTWYPAPSPPAFAPAFGTALVFLSTTRSEWLAGSDSFWRWTYLYTANMISTKKTFQQTCLHKLAKVRCGWSERLWQRPASTVYINMKM